MREYRYTTLLWLDEAMTRCHVALSVDEVCESVAEIALEGEV